MPTRFQEVLRSIVDLADGLVLVPSSIAKAMVRDGAGKRLRTLEVDPSLVLRVDGANLAQFIEMLRALSPSGVWQPDDDLLREVSEPDTMLVPIQTEEKSWVVES